MRFLTLLITLGIAAGGCASRSADVESPAQTRERTVYRQAVGGLGAGFLYQTHQVIGTTADLFGRKAIKPDEVMALMEVTQGMGRNVEEILSGVRSVPIGPADAKTVNNMMRVNRLLMQQAESLRNFAKSPTRQNARQFESSRSASWNRLSQLLNVPNDS